ncbi:hypothetical protein [Convivina praedatoris]|uniref:Uncharacterized protein n=1 Tax=Convivina praedatoris TaxID=2880963 RepID=A0ABN8H8C0_9LACO|nr:hypothetical protein LMG032447_00453 [Convivina sp. LMG 32447]CAH1852006.1 hypothetical protein R078138_00463 [Convivina sp. LMG 32447]CAH1852916.1 hypothetical protein R077815_00654 [Convivina sp. LMG 32447]
MLFTSSLFPYATSIVSENFDNRAAQIFYGLVVLSITASNQLQYYLLQRANQSQENSVRHIAARRGWAKYDVALKLSGMLLAMTVYPLAMIFSVLITLMTFVIPNQLKIKCV